jgi:hypothetical protein
MAEYVRGTCGNNLKWIDKLISNMVEVIVEYGSSDFWKVLKYPVKDALVNPAYTISDNDKVTLITNGMIKRKPFNSDVSGEAHNELRVFLYEWEGEGTDNYELTIGFDVICHNMNVDLQNGKTASMVMMSEILDLFNGSQVEKNVGKFIIDDQGGRITYYNTEYQGYRFYIKGWSS